MKTTKYSKIDTLAAQISIVGLKKPRRWLSLYFNPTFPFLFLYLITNSVLLETSLPTYPTAPSLKKSTSLADKTLWSSYDRSVTRKTIKNHL